MNNSIEIVKLDASHVEGIYEIEELSFVTPWSKASILKEVGNPIGRFIVMLDAEKVVAYGGFWVVAPDGYINNIAVHPDYRGKGLSKTLMEQIISMATKDQCKVISLEVRTGNHMAQKLYRSYGFQMVGLRKDYYIDTQEDAIVMELQLKDVSDERI